MAQIWSTRVAATRLLMASLMKAIARSNVIPRKEDGMESRVV
jgi:hypothetical protein